MAQRQKFPGREVPEADFTGLLESLSIIHLLADIGIETADHMRKEDLVRLLRHVNDEVGNAVKFSGATPEESKTVSLHILRAMSANR